MQNYYFYLICANIVHTFIFALTFFIQKPDIVRENSTGEKDINF